MAPPRGCTLKVSAAAGRGAPGGVPAHLRVERGPVQVEERERMQKFLAEKGISTGIHYPIPIHLQKSYQYLGYQKGSFPFTEIASDKIVSLPMFAELTDAQIEHVVNGIIEFE